MTIHRTATARVPLDVIARRLMDEGYRLGVPDDTSHEYARLVKPNKHTPNQEIILFRCGHITVTGEAWQRAAKALARLAEGARL
jgi:hypothetical protein